MTLGELYGGTRLESYPSSCAEESRLVNDDEADCSSGASTPPLWRTTDCPASPGNDDHRRSISADSRAQAIARGQKELMEMVSRMSEGCYELSLKDLVEHQLQIGIDPDRREEKVPERNSITDGGEIGRNPKVELGKKRSDVSEKNYNPPPVTAAKMTRSGSLDNGGFLLKMGCPVYSLRSRNKKKKQKKKGGSAASVSGGSPKDGRVSPRPLLVNGHLGPTAVGSGRMAESYWWKDGFPVEAETGESCESAAGFSSSSNSNHSRSSKSSRGSNGSRGDGSRRKSDRKRRYGFCCLFMSSSKGRVAE